MASPAPAAGGFGAAFSGIGGFTAGGDRRVAVDGELAGQAPAAPTGLDSLAAEEVMNRDMDNAAPTGGESVLAGGGAAAAGGFGAAPSASAKDAFELLGLEQDDAYTQRYSQQQVQVACDGQRRRLQHAADNILTQLTEAETTLIGWPRQSGPQTDMKDREKPLTRAERTADAQDDYVEALKRDTDGSAELKAGDERNAWRSYGKMVRVLESLPAHIRKKSNIKPLQIVVAGDESSGKSQAAQRIIGRELFEIKDEWCTKVPTKLCFHRSKHQHALKLSLTGTLISTGERVNETEYTYPKTAVQRCSKFYHAMAAWVNQWFDKILRDNGLDPDLQDGNGFPIDGEFTIEIWAPDVPDLILVDLPGLVNVPAAYAEQTRAHTAKWIRQPNSIVITIWPLDQNSLRAMVLGNIIQAQHEREGSFGRRHIGVMTKADFAAVKDHSTFQPLAHVPEVTKQMHARLLARLDGSHADAIEFRDWFADGRTWIPMVNKRIIDGIVHTDIHSVRDCFYEDNQLKCSGLLRADAQTASGVACPGAKPGSDVPEYGIRALHAQIHTVVEQQLRTGWRTQALGNLDEYKRALKKHGKDVYSGIFNLEQLHTEICDKVREIAKKDRQQTRSTRFSETIKVELAACARAWSAERGKLRDPSGDRRESADGGGSRQTLFQQPLTTADMLDDVKICETLNKSLRRVLVDGGDSILKNMLKKIADQIVEEVFGTKPYGYEQHLRYNPDDGSSRHSLPREITQDPKKYWRYGTEKDRFKGLLYARVCANADSMVSMLTNLPLIVLQKVEKFETLVDDALLQVVADCFLNPDPAKGIEGWYTRQPGAQLGPATELAIIVEARRDAAKERADIDTARHRIDQAFSPGGDGGGAAAASGFHGQHAHGGFGAFC